MAKFRVVFLSAAVLLLLGLSPFIWNAFLSRHYRERMYAPGQVPSAETALVFGAAVYRDGRLSPMLRDRVDTAIALYDSGRVQRLLFSGYENRAGTSEPEQMAAYAVARGVPATAIELDHAGTRTYDTCYRAVHVFQLESAVLVTQEFHLPRALFTCRSLGLEAAGAIADQRAYHPVSLAWSQQREFLANVLALIDVIRREPATIMSDPRPLD